MIAAVDAAAGQPADEGTHWPIHVLRASDGSHYVAFSLEPPASHPLPDGPALLYVRLATATASGPSERSTVREWLVGRRTDPRLLPQRGIAVGEMPAFGAGSIAVRGSTASTGSNDLKLMALERERARQEREAREKQRRDELEGRATAALDLLPFEDFDVASHSTSPTGARIVSRALTAGPGQYDLYVGWADPAAPRPATTVRVMRRTLSLPTASTTELTISSVIVADDVGVRAAPYPASEQSAHPYSIGLTEITPAPDTVFTRDERLAVAFQVINARPTESGKPDIAVDFRVVRMVGDREQPVASLNPQYYNQSTMPPEFDLRIGHPIFAAVAAPLTTLARGAYRLKIAVNDRVTGRTTTAATDFSVTGTPASLLSEAPPLGPPFRRDAPLEASRLTPVVEALRPASPSPALDRALVTATSGRPIDLLVEEPVPAGEQGVRAALTGIALYSVGDNSSAVQFQRALQLGAPEGPVQFLIGAVRAMQGRDGDAVAAWQAALQAGLAAGIVAPLLVDAQLRRGNTAAAAALIETALGGQAPAADSPWVRAYAAARLAAGREADAVAVLSARHALWPDDVEAHWLLAHALFAAAVKGTEPADAAERFRAVAEAYVAANGPHAALATEWLRAVPNRPPSR